DIAPTDSQHPDPPLPRIEVGRIPPADHHTQIRPRDDLDQLIQLAAVRAAHSGAGIGLLSHVFLVVDSGRGEDEGLGEHVFTHRLVERHELEGAQRPLPRHFSTTGRNATGASPSASSRCSEESRKAGRLCWLASPALRPAAPAAPGEPGMPCIGVDAMPAIRPAAAAVVPAVIPARGNSFEAWLTSRASGAAPAEPGPAPAPPPGPLPAPVAAFLSRSEVGRLAGMANPGSPAAACCAACCAAVNPCCATCCAADSPCCAACWTACWAAVAACCACCCLAASCCCLTASCCCLASSCCWR